MYVSVAIFGWLAFLLTTFFVFKFEAYNKKSTLIFTGKALYLDNKKLREVRSGSLNYQFLSYIYNHEGESISKSELQSALSCENEINFFKLIFNTRLPKEAKQSFFTVKNDFLIFNSRP